jgi:uncharacterized protein YutE (UPF0331/DUF86 family)
MTDPEVVLRKLTVAREHARRARRRHPASSDALAADEDLQDALSLSLLVAIQEAIDIAFHIATDEGWGLPASNAESFDTLARHGVLGAESARRMGAAAALRNRIAHGYASLDLPRLWAELPSGLDALDEYLVAVARYLEGSTTPDP